VKFCGGIIVPRLTGKTWPAKIIPLFYCDVAGILATRLTNPGKPYSAVRKGHWKRKQISELRSILMLIACPDHEKGEPFVWGNIPLQLWKFYFLKDMSKNSNRKSASGSCKKWLWPFPTRAVEDIARQYNAYVRTQSAKLMLPKRWKKLVIIGGKEARNILPEVHLGRDGDCRDRSCSRSLMEFGGTMSN